MFKVGDKVKCIKSDASGAFRQGRIYTVKSYNNDYKDQVCIELDSLGSKTNGWSEEFFILYIEDNKPVAKKSDTDNGWGFL